MTEFILEGETPVRVSLRRSAQARRLSLRVSRLDGRVTLTMPRHVPEREAVAFVREKEVWVRRQLDRQVAVRRPAFGGTIPVLGAPLEIIQGAGRGARMEAGCLVVPGGEDMLMARITAYLKLQARTRLRQASDSYAKALGVSFGKITLRDTRSRWGSCTSDGNLMYSWRLIMAPEAVLDYVAAHEVAHLLEMNHSPAYWAHVARVCPQYHQHRDWLRVHGQELHAWDFSH
ncbi:M48 family metallopeptidase [Celeribacter marinus]|uniref:M48 family metallopeptidase n=1 Tax=Celeribacter marinus TaxID=1397108 RepID=UPI003F6AD23F